MRVTCVFVSLAVAILVPPLLQMSAGGVPAPSPVGTVSALFGESELKITTNASGAVSSVEAPAARYVRQGADVFERDVIETGPEQTAKVTLRDETELVLAPSTTCLIETFVKNKGQGPGLEFRTVLNLMNGTLRSLVNHLYGGGQFYVVKTPNSIMGVRGTHFITAFDAKTESTSLHVLRGVVALGGPALGHGVAANPGATVVTAGQASSVNGAAGAAAPSLPRSFDRAGYRQQLRGLSPNFERAVGDDLSGARETGGKPRSLSDALKAKHDDQAATASPSDAPGAAGVSRNLRGSGPSLSGNGGMSGGPGAGGGFGSGTSSNPGAGAAPVNGPGAGAGVGSGPGMGVGGGQGLGAGGGPGMSAGGGPGFGAGGTPVGGLGQGAGAGVGANAGGGVAAGAASAPPPAPAGARR